MPNSIEIFENTLLKLIVRQGTNSDRLLQTFSSGELAYTTDTKRLYVGDGATAGGILVGNVFKGSASNITTLSPGSIGDLAFDNDNYRLYRLKSNDGSNIGDWEEIGGVYTAGDNTITITSDNKISIGLLSASNLDPSITNLPIYLDGSNKLSLSAILPVDQIIPKNTTSVTLFSALSVNGINYKFPNEYSPGKFLRGSDNDGKLIWDNVPLSAVSTNTVQFNFPLTATADGVDITGTAVNPLTSNIIVGVSPTLSCYNLWARYSAVSDSIVANKGISTVTRTDVGRYTLEYDFTLPIANPYVNVDIYGDESIWYQARIIEATDTQCKVVIYGLFDGGGVAWKDADFSVKIET